MRNVLLLAFSLLIAHEIFAQGNDTTGVWKEKDLNEVTVVSKSTTRRMAGAVNGAVITQDELFKAACCNLGESFTTNPSVDVNYSDAATGAKQIKLLGLSGTYVQMLTENLPNFRVAAAPYSLGYVPGPWMKSIQVSKGSASVRNGYESITGQIDVEYLKPDDDEGVTFRGKPIERISRAKARPQLKTFTTMVHFGKTQDDELQIIVTGQDIESLRRMIVSSALMERRTFYGLKEYIETEYKDIITKHQQQ